MVAAVLTSNKNQVTSNHHDDPTLTTIVSHISYHAKEQSINCGVVKPRDPVDLGEGNKPLPQPILTYP